MVLVLPSNITFGTVRGRFGISRLEAGDTDFKPNFVPFGELVVTFTPSAKYLLDRTATPDPSSIALEPVICNVDVNTGYLRGPDGSLGVQLIATDNPAVDPHGNWTYRVTYGGSKLAANFDAADITVPAASDRYLSVITGVPSSPGLGLTEVEVAQRAAAVSADQAAGSAGTASTGAATATAAASAAALSATSAAASAFGWLYLAATEPETMFTGNQVRNASGAPLSSTVKWPDGSAGVFTGVPSVLFPVAIDSYVMTYTGVPAKTFTQLTVTRNASGYVTTRPALTVT